MQLLYSSLKLLEAHHLKNLLEAEGIRCQLRNELISRLAGEIPFTECAPQIWLLDDSQLEAARRVVADFDAAAPGAPAWRCPRCAEELEGQFSACWRCGALRPQA